ncbi:MAG: zinc ribbon domain-containing protein [Candidatus Methanofastidiosia archaeon]|jgi:hypothetical protein
MNFRIKKVLCKNCGAENYPDAPFCIKCGGSFISKTESKNPILIIIAAGVIGVFELLSAASDDNWKYFHYLFFFIAILPGVWIAIKTLSKTGELTLTDLKPKPKINAKNKKLW